MIGIYFSGTGNTRYCIGKFLEEYGAESQAYSIEEKNAATAIQEHKEIVIAYPVQYSNIPSTTYLYFLCKCFFPAIMIILIGGGYNHGQK